MTDFLSSFFFLLNTLPFNRKQLCMWTQSREHGRGRDSTNLFSNFSAETQTCTDSSFLQKSLLLSDQPWHRGLSVSGPIYRKCDHSDPAGDPASDLQCRTNRKHKARDFDWQGVSSSGRRLGVWEVGDQRNSEGFPDMKGFITDTSQYRGSKGTNSNE